MALPSARAIPELCGWRPARCPAAPGDEYQQLTKAQVRVQFTRGCWMICSLPSGVTAAFHAGDN